MMSNSKTENTGIQAAKIITGLRTRLIRIGIISNIFFLLIIEEKNPFNAFRAFKKVQKKRLTIQGQRGFKKFIKTGRRYFFSENVPGWPSKAFNGFLRKEITRVVYPNRNLSLSTIILAITSRCRLGCNHCYEWDNISSTDRLTFKDLEEIVLKIKQHGVNHIQLSGGEPLERFDDLVKLIKHAGDKIDFWLLTSGFGLTYEKAQLLKKAGLSGADISLDHWAELEHNNSRNSPKAFWWVKEAVKNCNRAGLVTTLSLCAFRSFVTSGNLARYRDLAKDWGVGFIRILEPRKVGRFKGQDIMLTFEEIEILERFFIEMNSSDKFLEYPIVTYPGYHQRRIGCLGAGNRYLYIDSVGNVHACPFCQQSAGNAVSDPFEEVIQILKKAGCQEYETNLSE
jgi:MoaA/NifB/PqqE/SkfB family radical SAM enzyme